METRQELQEVYRVKVTSTVEDDGSITHNFSESTPNVPEVDKTIPLVVTRHEMILSRGKNRRLDYDVSKLFEPGTGRYFLSGAKIH